MAVGVGADDAVRIRNGERSKQQRVGHVENHEVGADTERESRDRHQHEAWTSGQHAVAVAEIPPDLFEPCAPPDIPDGILHLIGATEFQPGSATRRRLVHAVRHMLFNKQFEVRTNFLVEIPFDVPLEKQIAGKTTEKRHIGLRGGLDRPADRGGDAVPVRQLGVDLASAGGR
jgi:hypothetical protein